MKTSERKKSTKNLETSHRPRLKADLKHSHLHPKEPPLTRPNMPGEIATANCLFDISVSSAFIRDATL